MNLKCIPSVFTLIIIIETLLITYCAPQRKTPDVYTIKEDGTNRELLTVQIDHRNAAPYVTVTCFDYESLEQFNLANFDEFEHGTTSAIYINFINCFNNETHHKNYQQFRLHNALSEARGYVNCENFEIRFNDYGVVDSDTFFGELNLGEYKNVEINSIGFMDSSFLQRMHSGRILMRNTKQVNFDDFAPNVINVFRSEANTILNLTRMNLSKFRAIQILKFIGFAVHDYGILNVPNLFDYNNYLETLSFENITGDGTLVLDEAVFNGLHRLSYLDLKGINLETIPPNLFSDLRVLENVNLENNNLKVLHQDLFINNPALTGLQLSGNKLFSSHIVNLVLRHENITVDIKRSQFTGFDSVSSLIGNSNIKYMNLHESNLKSFKFSDFDQIQDRSTPIHIIMCDAELIFSIAQLRMEHINYEFFPYLTAQENENLNAIVYITAHDASLCCECEFIQNIFLYYLDGLPEDIEIYMPDSKVLFKIFTACIDLEKYYAHPFKHNCPKECACKFNPLLDKVYINCSGRGLQTIPKIPFPSQFSAVDSINLDMSKNYLNRINFDDQHDDVLKVLSTFDFMDNEIRSISLDEKAPLVIYDINLCGNEFLVDDNIVISLNINEQWTNATMAHCKLGTAYPTNIGKYIQNKSTEHIYDIIKNVRCNL